MRLKTHVNIHVKVVCIIAVDDALRTAFQYIVYFHLCISYHFTHALLLHSANQKPGNTTTLLYYNRYLPNVGSSLMASSQSYIKIHLFNIHCCTLSVYVQYMYCTAVHYSDNYSGGIIAGLVGL